METRIKAGGEPPPSGVAITLAGIRIARVSTVPFFVAAQLKLQISTLGKHGARVSVVASNGPEFDLLEGLEGVTCVPINIPRAISPWHDLLALFRLILFFKREKIQIAHSTTPKAGLLTALAAVVAGCPVRVHTFTGQPWVTMQGMKRFLMRGCDILIGRLNTRCYADSVSQKQFLVTQGIVDSRQLNVIGAGSLAGVDVRRFDRNRFSSSRCESIRQALGIPSEAKVLLFLGRITVEKGVVELLGAFERLKAAASDVHLIFVGRFDSDSGAEGAISRRDVEHITNMHLVDYTDTPEMYLAIADVLCLPSYREGFGTVVIEAAAMGVPTVGTAIYGLTDAVVHGETGLLVPPRDVERLKEALQRLLTDKYLRAAMGEAARRRAVELFDASKFNELVVVEYLDLLREKRILITP